MVHYVLPGCQEVPVTTIKSIRALALTSSLALPMLAQNLQRQAAIVGGGDNGRGKCTFEVVVDGAAEVEIRGTNATLRTLNGRPAQWRRFECSSAMPVNPGDFRFAGVDGRGRSSLVRDPRNGGVAVVRIEDRDGGAEGYTFDIMWDARGGGGSPGFPVVPNGGPRSSRDWNDRDDDYRPNYRDSDYYRRYQHGFSGREAVRLCHQAVYDQAARRYRSNDIHFNRTHIDDGPGRQDFVIGTLDVHRPGTNRENRFRFSCAVDFNRGTVRSVDFDPRPIASDRWRP
jgi:hypothetical protein